MEEDVVAHCVKSRNTGAITKQEKANGLCQANKELGKVETSWWIICDH